MSDNNQQGQQQKYQVTFDENTPKTGHYSNVASVHVNKSEVILDFGYMMPNSNPPQILINSRVNLNHETAKSFISMFQNAMLDYENKVKKSEK